MTFPAIHEESAVLHRIRFGFVLLVAGTPLYLAPGFFFPFVSFRGLLFRAFVGAGSAVLLVCVLRAGRLTLNRRDPVFWALVALTAAQALTASFSLAPSRSFFGTLERMGGVWTWIYVTVFYLLLRSTLDGVRWIVFLRTCALVSGLAGVYALLQRYQLALGIRWEGSPLGTTNGPIGNSGIFGGYLVLAIGLAVLLFVSDRRRLRVAYAVLIAVLAWSLVLTQNRSGLLALGAGVASASIVGLWSVRRGKILTAAVILVLAILALTLREFRAGRSLDALTPQLPGIVARAVSTSPTAVGVDRLIQWKAAMRAFRDRPLIGYGPENHDAIWSRHFDPAIYHVITDERWDRTHSAYIESLGTTGLIGTTALAVVWLSVFASIWKAYRAGATSATERSILIGVNAAYAVYLVFWFFDLTALVMWVILAAYVSSRYRPPLLEIDGRRALDRRAHLLIAATLLAFSAGIYVHVVTPLRESWRLGHLQNATESTAEVIREFARAFRSRSPYRVSAVTLFPIHLATNVASFPSLRADSEYVAAMADALRAGVVASEQAVSQDPFNDRLKVSRARIAILEAEFFRSPELAARGEAGLREAIAANPRRIAPRLFLSDVLYSTDRLDAALSQTDTALAIYPYHRETFRFRLAIFMKRGELDSALASARNAIKYGASEDATLFISLAQRLTAGGDASAAAAMLHDYLGAVYGPYALWERVPRSPSRRHVRSGRAAAAMLPVLLARAGDRTGAETAASAFASICPRSRTRVADFVAVVRGGNDGAWRDATSLASSASVTVDIIRDVAQLCEAGGGSR